MKYTVCFEYYGSIEIDTIDEDAAEDAVYEMSSDYLLEYTNGVHVTNIIDETGKEHILK